MKINPVISTSRIYRELSSDVESDREMREKDTIAVKNLIYCVEFIIGSGPYPNRQNQFKKLILLVGALGLEPRTR